MVEEEIAVPCGDVENLVIPEPLPVPEAEHLERLQESFALRGLSARARRRQGKRRRCELQRAIRKDSAGFYRRLRNQGSSTKQAAARLGIRPRTLRQWERRYRLDSAGLFTLGRPRARSERAARQAVLDYIKERGPGVGVPTLQSQFPDSSRAELTDLIQRYRRVLYDRYRSSQRVLHWRVPGRVWALDWAEPSLDGRVLPAIDGRFPYLLAVRDLASGLQLCWQPVLQPTTAIAMTILASLFADHGAPLVLKSDNGSSFRSEAMKRFLEHAGVFSLFSPPHWPGYNGAIEAAIGSLKTRTAQEAACRGRMEWTSADVEAARQLANVNRPRRLRGRTPVEVWGERTQANNIERVRFELTVQRHRYLARNELNIAPDEILDHWQHARLDRKGIQRALVEHDYLLFKGRRLPLIVSPGKVTFFV
jgi:transposase InsO family protein